MVNGHVHQVSTTFSLRLKQSTYLEVNGTFSDRIYSLHKNFSQHSARLLVRWLCSLQREGSSLSKSSMPGNMLRMMTLPLRRRAIFCGTERLKAGSLVSAFLLSGITCSYGAISTFLAGHWDDVGFETSNSSFKMKQSPYLELFGTTQIFSSFGSWLSHHLKCGVVIIIPGSSHIKITWSQQARINQSGFGGLL